MAKIVRFRFGEKDVEHSVIGLKCSDEEARCVVQRVINYTYGMIHACLDAEGYVDCITIEETLYNAFLGWYGISQIFFYRGETPLVLTSTSNYGYYDVPYIKLEETSDEYIVCVTPDPVELKGET